VIRKTPPSEKSCNGCGRSLPIDQFRRRSKGTNARQSRCRECHNAYMRAYRRRGRDKLIARFAAQVQREHSLRRVAMLCEKMFRRFGGIDGFSAAWAAQINTAVAERPGRRFVLHGFSAIARLAEIVESNGGAPDYSALTDEQLDQELIDLLGRLGTTSV